MINEGYTIKNTSVDDLNQRIEIKAAKAERGTKGNVKYTYKDTRCTVWASVKAFGAKITNSTAEQANEIDYRVIIRYRNDVSHLDRIVWKGKTLYLTIPPINVESRNIWLQMDCKELKEK